jgi:hypothetical protein
MVTGSTINLHVWESDDRETWTRVTTAGEPIAIAPGGSADFGFLSAKRYLMVSGYGETSGGYVRADFQFRGDPFFGQIDVEMLGKSGYGYDLGMLPPTLDGAEASTWVASAPTSVNYATADSPRGAGIGDYTATDWPSLE